MTVIGYARVSTTDQDLDIQVAALKREGCTVIRSEKRSGTTTQGRDELRTVLDFLGDGDVLMVTRIDRLARSIGDLQDIVLLPPAQIRIFLAAPHGVAVANPSPRRPSVADQQAL
jgi:DNA invertase Pin-like site-specific DNA recombinase